MEHREQRVWERVLGQTQNGPEDLGPLILASRQQLDAFAHLARNAGSKTKPLLQGLQQEETGILNCLKGLRRLQGKAAASMPGTVSKEPAERLLELCFHRSLRARQEYMARSAGGTYGEVFRILADRAAEQCARIVEVLGNM